MSPRPYRIFETRQFLNDQHSLGASAQQRLEIKLREHVYPVLRQEPHFGPNIKRLKNWAPPTWRYRVASPEINMFSASLPEGVPLSANGWMLTPDAKDGSRPALLVGKARSYSWDGKGGRHCPSYVKG